MSVIDDIAAIQRRVAKAYGVSVGEIISMRQERRPTEARVMAMWLARNMTGASYPCLGRAFDRDHSTVLRDVRSVERRRANLKAAATAQGIGGAAADRSLTSTPRGDEGDPLNCRI